MKKREFLLGLLVLFNLSLCLHSSAQNPADLQYTYALQGTNPAYAGSWDMFGITATGQQQLLSKTFGTSVYNISLQSPIANSKHGIGLFLQSYGYGPTTSLAALADYSYKISLGSTEHLRLGLRIKYNNFTISNMQSVNGPDQTAAVAVYDNANLYGLGFGAFYSNKTYYLGLAVPTVKGLTFYTGTIASATVLTLDAGYQMNVNEILDFIPSVNAGYITPDVASATLNADFLIYNKIWLGGSYQIGANRIMGAKLYYRINDQLMAGYELQNYTDGSLSTYRYDNHKLILSYAVRLNKKRISSPRFF